MTTKNLLLHLKIPKEPTEKEPENILDIHKSFVAVTPVTVSVQTPTLEECEQERAKEEETFTFEQEADFLQWEKQDYDKNMILSEINRLQAELEKTCGNCAKKQTTKELVNTDCITLRNYIYDDPESMLNDGNLCCWWCTEPFYGIIYRYPVSFSKTKNKYRVTGCFCGFPCIFAYGWKNNSSPCFHSSLILNYLKQKFPDEIITYGRAYDYTENIKFGGTKTTAQVRQREETNIRKRGKDPFVPIDKTKLRYARTKPLPNEVNNPLLHFMTKK